MSCLALPLRPTLYVTLLQHGSAPGCERLGRFGKLILKVFGVPTTLQPHQSQTLNFGD
jgi:hypothetical protein